MKFQINDSAVGMGSALNLDAATEALVEAAQRCGDAYDAVLSCESAVAEISQVIDDCTLACESIERFGVTAQTMSIFNQENKLTDALAMKSLAMESLESMSVATKKCLKADYTAALEGIIGNAWNKFVEFLKRMWEAVKRWFAELFDRNAKYLRIVQEAIKDKSYLKAGKLFTGGTAGGVSGVKGSTDLASTDKLAEKQFKSLSYDQIQNALAACDSIAKCLELGVAEHQKTDGDISGRKMPGKDVLEKCGFTIDEKGVVSKGEKFADVNERKSDTMTKHFGNVRNFGKACQDFSKCLSGSAMKAQLKSAESYFKNTIKTAEEAKNDDAKKDAAKKKAEFIPALKSYIMAYNMLVGLVGASLVPAIKACA